MYLVASPIAHARQQIEIDGDAGELIEMIHRCGPTTLLVDVTARNGTRSAAVPVVAVVPPPPPLWPMVFTVVTSHVQIIEIRGSRALLILHFEMT